ncbi:unnamed protein product, partial [Ectocarpus sp. 8 AP-2014]
AEKSGGRKVFRGQKLRQRKPEGPTEVAAMPAPSFHPLVFRSVTTVTCTQRAMACPRLFGLCATLGRRTATACRRKPLPSTSRRSSRRLGLPEGWWSTAPSSPLTAPSLTACSPPAPCGAGATARPPSTAKPTGDSSLTA